MSATNEIQAVQTPVVAEAVQAVLDARAGSPGVLRLEQYVTVATYTYVDAFGVEQGGIEVNTNVQDPAVVARTLGIALETVLPSVERVDPADG